MMQHAQLFAGGGTCARLSYYARGGSMPAHHHGVHQFSCLLAGEFLEAHAGCEREIGQPSVGVKPAGLEHHNQYGPNGALILSINLEPDRLDEYLPGRSIDWRWQAGVMTGRDRHSAMTLAALPHGSDAEAETIICDLLAVMTPQGGPRSDAWPRPAVPGWLIRARDALRDSATAPDLKCLADEAGVHRVHLSRAFRDRFGVPPSLYRRRCRLAGAIADMLQGASLADAAHGAGFADQSHFTRLARTETGYSPHRLRTLLAAA
ncbi:helix-turn-helix domain-containing protein [uncultured Maricaulis sp.]|uniref:helix-turn-helix domain-containing protein n=1 Tax=uncultured Maricaulis sp. TaxID=174710 RepID=UPI0030D95BFD